MSVGNSPCDNHYKTTPSEPCVPVSKKFSELALYQAKGTDMASTNAQLLRADEQTFVGALFAETKQHGWLFLRFSTFQHYWRFSGNDRP